MAPDHELRAVFDSDRIHDLFLQTTILESFERGTHPTYNATMYM